MVVQSNALVAFSYLIQDFGTIRNCLGVVKIFDESLRYVCSSTEILVLVHSKKNFQKKLADLAFSFVKFAITMFVLF